MNILKWLLDLFKPIDCYCQCHTGGFDKNAIIKGRYMQVSCEHCCDNPKPISGGKWGTALP